MPGTYFVDEVSGAPTPRIFATIGAGWRRPRFAQTRGVDRIWNADIRFMWSSATPSPCTQTPATRSDGYHPGPVDTVDGLVAALSEQQGWAEVTAPSDISVDGYVGKAFQRTAPADMSGCSTGGGTPRTRMTGDVRPYPDVRSWDNADGELGGGDCYEPGEIETLWVLDIDGTVVVISTGAVAGAIGGGPRRFRRRRARLDPHRAPMNDVPNVLRKLVDRLAQRRDPRPSDSSPTVV